MFKNRQRVLSLLFLILFLFHLGQAEARFLFAPPPGYQLTGRNDWGSICNGGRNPYAGFTPNLTTTAPFVEFLIAIGVVSTAGTLAVDAAYFGALIKVWGLESYLANSTVFAFLTWLFSTTANWLNPYVYLSWDSHGAGDECSYIFLDSGTNILNIHPTLITPHVKFDPAVSNGIKTTYIEGEFFVKAVMGGADPLKYKVCWVDGNNVSACGSQLAAPALNADGWVQVNYSQQVNEPAYYREVWLEFVADGYIPGYGNRLIMLDDIGLRGYGKLPNTPTPTPTITLTPTPLTPLGCDALKTARLVPGKGNAFSDGTFSFSGNTLTISTGRTTQNGYYGVERGVYIGWNTPSTPIRLTVIEAPSWLYHGFPNWGQFVYYGAWRGGADSMKVGADTGFFPLTAIGFATGGNRVNNLPGTVADNVTVKFRCENTLPTPTSTRVVAATGTTTPTPTRTGTPTVTSVAVTVPPTKAVPSATPTFTRTPSPTRTASPTRTPSQTPTTTPTMPTTGTPKPAPKTCTINYDWFCYDSRFGDDKCIYITKVGYFDENCQGEFGFSNSACPVGYVPPDDQCGITPTPTPTGTPSPTWTPSPTPTETPGGVVYDGLCQCKQTDVNDPLYPVLCRQELLLCMIRDYNATIAAKEWAVNVTPPPFPTVQIIITPGQQPTIIVPVPTVNVVVNVTVNPPVVNVTVPPPVVNITVPPPIINITVNPPGQAQATSTPQPNMPTPSLTSTAISLALPPPAITSTAPISVCSSWIPADIKIYFGYANPIPSQGVGLASADESGYLTYPFAWLYNQVLPILNFVWVSLAFVLWGVYEVVFIITAIPYFIFTVVGYFTCNLMALLTAILKFFKSIYDMVVLFKTVLTTIYCGAGVAGSLSLFVCKAPEVTASGLSDLWGCKFTDIKLLLESALTSSYYLNYLWKFGCFLYTLRIIRDGIMDIAFLPRPMGGGYSIEGDNLGGLTEQPWFGKLSDPERKAAVNQQREAPTYYVEGRITSRIARIWHNRGKR